MNRVEIAHEIFDPRGQAVRAESSPDEPWYEDRAIATREKHFYVPLVDFALKTLGKGSGSCLVVGSPIFEALDLQDAGWKVDYLDIRQPPTSVHWIEGDASAMPIGDAAYDAVSSTCVLCHVGLGRYGDPVNENADFAMMREIGRVLKPGGLAALCAGPVADCQFTRRLGTMHRVYVRDDIDAIVAEGGLETLEASVWNTEGACWRHSREPMARNVENIPDYLSMVLRKKDT